MPVIDLKHVLIYFEDGTSSNGLVNNGQSGTVNNVSGYLIGATTIIVAGFTGILPVNSAFTVSGNPQVYKIVSTVQTGGNTTSITFTPGLVAAAANGDAVVVNGYAAGASVIAVDGFTAAPPVGARLSLGTDDQYTVVSATTTSITFTPVLFEAQLADEAVVTVYGVYLKIKVGDGTLTWSEKRPRDYKKDRGLLNQVRDGDQEPMDVTFNLMYEELTASTGDPPSPEDALKQRGSASTWISAETSDPCAPFAINIRLDNFQQPGCTAVQAERTILPKFRYESLDHNPKDGTISCQGKCNATQAQVSRFTAAVNPTANVFN